MRHGVSETFPIDAADGEAGRYEIRVKGHLDDQWAAWFEGQTLTREESGTTLLTGPAVDQAALYGLLKKVRDVGMPLISVIRIDVGSAEARRGGP